ncbi:MAG: AAR2 protein-domain-containing protein, partial [Olpidium bornovanus]
MDPQTATALFDRGAFFVFADAPIPDNEEAGGGAGSGSGGERENEAAAGAPPALSFGIDLHIWTAGEKFMGMKLVPPGLHCVHYSLADLCEPKILFLAALASATRTLCRTPVVIVVDTPSRFPSAPAGISRVSAALQVVVKKWDPHAENWFPDSQVGEDERERYRVKSLRFAPRPLPLVSDRRLGPYPLTAETSTYERWKALTSFVTPGVLKTVLPAGGLLTSATCPEPEPGTDGVVPGPERNAIPAARQQGAPGTHSAFPAQTIPSVTAHFADFDLRKSFPKGAAPELIT